MIEIATLRLIKKLKSIEFHNLTFDTIHYSFIKEGGPNV